MNNPISEWNRDFRLLALAVASQGIFFGVQLTLFNNFIVDRLNIEAHELGYVESLREVPGFMNAFFVALMVRFAPPIVAAIFAGGYGLGDYGILPGGFGFCAGLVFAGVECGVSLLDPDGAVNGVAFFARGQEGKVVGAVAKRE